MSGARRREPSSAELPPLHIAAARGCRRCLQLLLREQQRPEPAEQDGKRAVELALQQGTRRWHSHRAQGGHLVQDSDGARCSLSFLTEDGTEASIFPTDGLLSSTRRSLLEELEDGCGLGDPPPLSIPSFTPWPYTDPGGPPQPLASSTLLEDGPGEGPPRSWAVGERKGPPWPHPRASPVPSSRQEFGPSGSLSSPHPQRRGRVLGERGDTPTRAAHARRGGLSSWALARQHPTDCGDLGAVAQHPSGVPQRPPMGWAGLGSATLAATGLGPPLLEVGVGGWDHSNLGDSEVFLSAMETLEPSKGGGCQGAQHRCSPQPWAAREPEPGETPSPKGAAPWHLPPVSPPDAEWGQGEGSEGVWRASPGCGEGSGGGETRKLLAQFQGCSIQDRPLCTPEPFLSSSSLASGDVTPQGQGSPGHLHVTPRTRSRLQACAQRFSSSSSSSLFDDTLEMPRRPPRLRAPPGVPRCPATTSGHCVTPQGEDEEGTGSLDDTEILPRAPSQPSSPPGASSSSSPTVLLLPGDHQHPQDSPSDAQGSPRSTPPVLLIPRGHHPHPQNSPSDAQGSPSSNSPVLLVPRDHHLHPKNSSSDAQGSPKSTAPVLVPRDHHLHPQNSPSDAQGSPSSNSPVLLVPRDHHLHPKNSSSDAQGSPKSTAPVLVPRDHHPHPKNSSSDAQGSPSSTPPVLLDPRDHHPHPQDFPSDAQGSSSPTVLLVPEDQDLHPEAPGSTHAAGSANLRVLGGGSGLQHPPPLRTQRSPGPHDSFGHFSAPHLPGSTLVAQGSSGMLLCPLSRSSHGSEERLEGEEQGQAPTEQHSPGTEAIASPQDATAQDGQACPVPPRRLSDAALRRRLRALGDSPGPITDLTRGLYLRRLQELARAPRGHRTARTPQAGHSPELEAALRTGQVPDCTQDELVLAQQFDHPDRSWHWREGLAKSSFNYLLLDPRTTQNLPLRSHCLSPAECFRTFIKAIFYVGKGTRARPYCHLTAALSQHRAGTQRGCPKVRRILEIWASGQGVVSLHCFHNSVPAEAYTRESCLVEALGLQTITNQRQGHSYGAAARWAGERRRRLGVHLLHRAMRIFLAEGERQLRPADIQGGR